MRVAGIPLGVGNIITPVYNPSLCFGLYHCDGAANTTSFSDSSPANRNLSNTGTMLIVANPKFGTGAMRSHQNYYDRCHVDSTVDLGNDNFTFELFFLIDTSSGDPLKGLLSNSNAIGTEDWILYLDGNNIKFRVRLSTDGLMTLQHQDAVISSGWNYVKVLRKDGFIKLGLNGTESSTTITCGSQNVTNNSTVFGVGCMYNTNPDYTSFVPFGFIDEIRLNKQAVVGWDIPIAPFEA